jgi:pimeloyl-ACP methyl ester carboxylesterase
MNWVLLRGLGRESRHWGDFVTVLKKSPSVGEVLALDLPGTGQRYRESSPASVRGMAEKVREEFLTKKGAGDWGVVGMSLGGMIAMEWAHRHPLDFARVVLINTSARGAGLPWQRMQPWAARQLALIARTSDLEAKERLVLEMTAVDSQEWAPQFAVFAQERPIALTTSLRQLAAALAYEAPKAMSCPTRLLIGQRDRMVAPKCSQALATRWGAEINEHPTGGHDLALDDPQWTADQISSFGA